MRSSVLLVVLPALSLAQKVDHEEALSELEWTMAQLPHHREKRFLFMTDEKRIVMPPGSQLVLAPTLALPFLRYPPDGLDANMSISTPFTLSFDKMGVTDNQNPFGLIPLLNPIIGNSIFGRRKRSVPDPDTPPHKIHAGERAFLYEYLEDYLFTFGMDGKSCLLRAICEMHESPLVGYGLVGELLEIFLTPSRSPYWNRMAEYISAEQSGKKHGDCQKFEKDCSRSLFKLNKYSKAAQLIKPKKQLQLEDFLNPDFKNQVHNDIM